MSKGVRRGMFCDISFTDGLFHNSLYDRFMNVILSLFASRFIIG